MKVIVDTFQSEDLCPDDFSRLGKNIIENKQVIQNDLRYTREIMLKFPDSPYTHMLEKLKKKMTIRKFARPEDRNSYMTTLRSNPIILQRRDTMSTRDFRYHLANAAEVGEFEKREQPLHRQTKRSKMRDFDQRAFTVGIGGPVGSGKTALLLSLCRDLRDKMSIAVVTNDIFTREDAEFLTRNDALEHERIAAVETGGCPHAAIREDVSGNLEALENLTASVSPSPSILFCESGGDNLAANFSRELADYTIYVIDVAGGDKVPRKGGPGITQSDLLIINKTDLADAVGADLDVMEREAKEMRGGHGPTVMGAVKHGNGVEDIKKHILDALAETHQH